MDDDPDLPALTEAEARFVDNYLQAADLLARLNPDQGVDHAYRLVRASQDLVAVAVDLRQAVDDLWQRGQQEVFGATLTRALLALDGERRTRRVVVAAPGP